MRNSIPYWTNQAKRFFDLAVKKGLDGLNCPYYLLCLKHIERIKKESGTRQ